MTQTPIWENEHFIYRLGPTDIYIDSQRDNKAFAHDGGSIMLSEDNGLTWPHTRDFEDANNITFSCILMNGNVVFATREKLFLSEDKLKTVEEITVNGLDGEDYLPHTPQDPDRPGFYFQTVPGINSWDVNGTEMLVWGNYCNVVGGAAPVNIYYSTDGGRTVKIAYAFGQNPNMRDDGSPGGGREGTLLGNPDNKIIARHTHGVTYNPAENAFYACTGDGDNPEQLEWGLECHWLRGTYDPAYDQWDWRVIVTGSSNSNSKASGINFVDNIVYWVSDANGPEPYDRGVFCCKPEDIPDRSKHRLLFNPGVELGCMIVQDGVFLASHCAPASPLDCGIVVSVDGGNTWAQHDLKECGRRSGNRFHEKNSDGWFRLDLRTGWVDYGEVLFIKPKI